MGCGASTQAAIKEKAVAAYDNAKERASAAVSQGKYYAAGCKFDPDAQGLQKSLVALEKGLKSANASYETWAKKVRPLSSALINHWAETTEMPQAAKDELKAAAAIISGAGRAHKAYTDAVMAEYCVKGLKAAADRAKPALDLYHAYEEAEYNLVYERKMHAKKLAETEGKEEELQKASNDALAAAKKSLEETLAAIENDILIPALAKPAELAAQLCATVAEGNFPPPEKAAAAGAEGGEGEEPGEESVAATLQHADSKEFHDNRFAGLGKKDAVEMARQKYAEMKTRYKNVALPEEFKETEKMLGLHKTHLYAVSHKANAYCKKSLDVIFGPDKDVLSDTLSKLMGFANLKKAVADLGGKMTAAVRGSEAAKAFVAVVDETGKQLCGLVDDDAGGSVKEARDLALEYQGAVYKWKVAKDRLKVLETDEAKAKEADKPFDEKKAAEKTKLGEDIPALEKESTDLSAKFYELAANLYESDQCAVVTRGVPAVKSLADANVAFFASCKERFVA